MPSPRRHAEGIDGLSSANKAAKAAVPAKKDEAPSASAAAKSHSPPPGDKATVASSLLSVITKSSSTLSPPPSPSTATAPTPPPPPATTTTKNSTTLTTTNVVGPKSAARKDSTRDSRYTSSAVAATKQKQQKHHHQSVKGHLRHHDDDDYSDHASSHLWPASAAQQRQRQHYTSAKPSGSQQRRAASKQTEEEENEQQREEEPQITRNASPKATRQSATQRKAGATQSRHSSRRLLKPGEPPAAAAAAREAQERRRLRPLSSTAAAAGAALQKHGQRKLMPSASGGAASDQRQRRRPTTATRTGGSAALAGHAKSSLPDSAAAAAALAKAEAEAATERALLPTASASRSVRVKSTAAALSSSTQAAASLQQPLSFESSKLQSTRLHHNDDSSTTSEKPIVNHQSTNNQQQPQPTPTNQRSTEAIAGRSLLSRATSKLFPKSSSPLLSSIKTMADQAVIDKLEAGYAKLQATTPEQCHSLLKKYLTREVLDKNKAKKTAMGASLLDVCQSGFENLDSGVGIYAPDAESYTLFSDLFNPIIEDYHGGFKATDKHPASDFGDLESLVNVDPDNQFVISTRVRCGRSLQGYPFNPCLTEAQYKEMETKVSTTLKEVEGDLAGTYYPLTGMTKETQQQLIDDHFLFKEGDRFLQAANACRYWPTGRGIYHNKEKTFLVWVNEEDHLRIISMQKGGDLKTVFGRLVRGARAIEAKVPFSRDDRLGFLTFCPTNLGTTIRASVHIKLPKLAADRKKLEEVASRYNLQVRGTSGEHTESVGGVYDISNKRRLGLTEYQAVREMQDGILELIKIEKSL